MMIKRIVRVAVAVVLMGLVVAAVGCGKKPEIRTPDSLLDTPRAAYERGQVQLEAGQLPDAERSFRRAIELDPEYAPGHEGLGLVALERGDVAAAEKHFDRSLDKDENFLRARVGQARVRTAQGRFEDAEGKLKDVLKKAPDLLVAHYWQGKNYAAWGGHDGEAMASWQSILERDPGNLKATAAMDDLVKLRAATSGVPPEYVRLASVPSITREDLAALVAVELEPTKLFRKPDQVEADFKTPEAAAAGTKAIPGLPGDVAADNWAAPYVAACLKGGMLDLFPGDKFMPKRPVTRADFALTLERALVAATGDQDLHTRYVGSQSEYADVPSDHYALNAIKVCTTRGLMSAGLDGKFRPTGPVSGTEALLMLGKLREILE